MKVLRLPALHFLVIGAALFFTVGDRLVARDPDATEALVVSAADIKRLHDDWIEEHGSPAGAAVLQGLIEATIDEEILYREALRLRLDTRAAVVRDRLVHLARFVEESPGEAAEHLERAARRLGLQQRDLVIRRHLVQAMRLLLVRDTAVADVQDDGLQRYYDQHLAEITQPPRLRLTHVYFAHRPETPAATRALQVLEVLRQQTVPLQQAAALGDPFIRGAQMGPATAHELQATFGPDFAAAVETLALATWSAPLASPYGAHLVWIDERIAAGPPPLPQVRARVLHQALAERRQDRLRESLRHLRRRYLIHVEAPADDAPPIEPAES